MWSLRKFDCISQKKYSIDINDQSFSSVKLKWKIYEYIHTSISSNNSTSVKRIDLQEEDFLW